MNLDDYLRLDDHAITEFLKAAAEAKDSVLKNLAIGLLHRCLFKAVDVTDFHPSHIAKFTNAAIELIKKLGLNPDYTFVDDSPGDTPYKPYDPDAEEPATQIYVEAVGGQKELSRLSRPVEELKVQYTLLRYYYPEPLRVEIEKIANRTLEGRA